MRAFDDLSPPDSPPSRQPDRLPDKLPDCTKSREQLLAELSVARHRLHDLESAACQHQQDKTRYHTNAATAQALLGVLPDMLLHLHYDGVFLDFNLPPEFLNFIPFDLQLFRGQTVYDLFSAAPGLIDKARLDEGLALLERAVRTRSLQVFRFSLAGPREERHYEARIMACGPDDALVLVRDLTTERAAERSALELALEQQKRGILADLMQAIAEEIGAPLRELERGLDAVDQMTDPAAPLSQTLQRLRQRAEAIYELIAALLTLSDLDRLENQAGIQQTGT